MKHFLGIHLIFLLTFGVAFADPEVIPETETQVLVREHPRTGKPFVVITSAGYQQKLFEGQTKLVKRPDYRMLDPKVKSSQVAYDGPSSDRKKIYILAASLATIGTVGGVGIIATAPAATGAGATGGAGVFAGAGTAVAAGTLGGTYAAAKTNGEHEDFTHVFESHAVKSQD